MQKITTFLTYNDQAEEAANFYTTLFENSKINDVMRAGDAVMGVSFQLAGQQFNALNGGPSFNFSEGISLYVDCKTQAEVDELWEKLIADGGEESRCGWLKDKFGVSWQ
ncbi:MAG TPA: VOC family protein, partial [Anaerolineales bacterium]|nr:VOC family protein [Anaerolineales bacterium]